MLEKKNTKKVTKNPRPEGLEGLGKLPPQALDLEEAVLGALMLERDALGTVIEILKPESFYKEAHQKIYKAVMDLYDGSDPIDILTVTNRLRSKGELEIAGGAYYVTELTTKANSADNIEYHARIVAEQAVKRELISIATSIERDAYEDTTDVFELVNIADKKISDLNSGNFKNEPKSISDLTKESHKHAIEISKIPDGMVGQRTGFNDFDNHTKGWRNGNLIIIAARPGMGKSSLAHSAAYNSGVNFNVPVAIFSLEMSSEEVTAVLESYQTGIDYEMISSGEYINNISLLEQYHHKIGPLLNAPIYIDDTAAISITELRAKARKLVKKMGVKAIYIDYLQLMSGPVERTKSFGNREQEVSQISAALKRLAKELKVPIIALSQLSRSVETRGGDKRPQLSDLRESGAIEQDADMVVFLYRPAYYFDSDSAGNKIDKYLNLMIIAKWRGGKLKDIETKFIGRLKRFIDYNNTSLDDDDLPEKPTSFFDSSNVNEFDDKQPF